MFSCDYNGWADVPEEQREAIDAFEAAGPPTAQVLPVRWKEARSWALGAGSELGADRRRAA